MSTAAVLPRDRAAPRLREFVDRMAWLETRRWTGRLAAAHGLLLVLVLAFDPAQREASVASVSSVSTYGFQDFVGVLLAPFGVLLSALIQELVLRGAPSWISDRILGGKGSPRWILGISIALLPAVLLIVGILYEPLAAAEPTGAPWQITLLVALAAVEACVYWFLMRRHGFFATVTAAWLVMLISKVVWASAGLLLLALRG